MRAAFLVDDTAAVLVPIAVSYGERSVNRLPKIFLQEAWLRDIIAPAMVFNPL